MGKGFTFFSGKSAVDRTACGNPTAENWADQKGDRTAEGNNTTLFVFIFPPYKRDRTTEGNIQLLI